MMQSATPPSRIQAVRRVLLSALFLGLATGLLHAMLLAVEHHLLGRLTWYSREFIWMSPVAYGLVFLAAAVPLLLVALVRPTWAGPRGVAWYFGTGMAFGLLLPWPQLGRPAAMILAVGVGVQLARWAAASDRRWDALAARGAMLAAGFVLLTALAQPRMRGWRETLAEQDLGAVPAGNGAAPNVLLIILDTVRAASLSLHGFPYPTTPTLERVAHDATVFDWAIAPAPWTLPSHASIFTGRHAGELTADWNVPLDGTTPVLTEAFRSRGYHTAAVVANLDYTAWDSGLDRGFAHFEDYPVAWRQLLLSSSYTQTVMGRRLLAARSPSAVVQALSDIDLSIEVKHAGANRRADAVTGSFLAWHATHRDRPFFAFLNYFDAHQGYYAPPGFATVGDTSRPGARYTTAIAWIDRNLDTLFSTLAARGDLDRTIVIVTSDHGELFDEHGLSGHAHNLYRNVLHVPLLIRYPGAVPGGHRVAQQVSLRDLAATISDLAGLPAGAFPGTSLRTAWESAAARPGPVVAEVRRAPNVSPRYPTAHGDLAASFDDSTHYIRHLADGRAEAFAYRTDASEAHELSGDSARVGPVRAALDAFLAARRRRP